MGAEDSQFSGMSSPVAASVGGGRQVMAPRLSFYAGLNHEPAPGVSTFVALTANAAPHSAALPSQGPVSVGAVLGFQLRF
jgi:hypothetical protein